MKRIRTEQLQSTVSQYLKRRQYTGCGDAKECRSTQSVEEMSLMATVLSESSISNSIAYSSISGDATACDQLYNRLKTFVHDSPEHHRSQLQTLLYPLFVNIYLELLQNAQTAAGQKFYGRHLATFKSHSDCADMLAALQQISNKEAMLSCHLVREFRDHRYVVSLSPDTLQYLLKYLQNGDNVLLVQMLSRHLDIKLRDVDLSEDVETTTESLAPRLTLASPQCVPENKVIQSEVKLGELHDCIRRVREGPASLPSISLYTVVNAHQGLCCADISGDESRLCTGFEDSSIRVWSLGTEPLQIGTAAPVNIAMVHLAGDFLPDVVSKNRSTGSQEKDCVTLRGHGGAVYGTCFTQDGQFLISASEDTTLRLWEPSSRSCKARYRGHNHPVWGVDTSSTGAFFASCSHDRTARLWSPDRLYPIRTFIGHTMDVDCVRFHPNGSYLATGSCDETVRLWTIHDGKSVRLFHGHRGPVHALAFSPDGKYLASAGEDKRVKIWDLSVGTLFRDLKGHTDAVHALRFNRDSTTLASGGLDGTVRVWDVHTGGSSSNNKTADGTTKDGLNLSSELLGAFPTKTSSIHHLRFAKTNLLFTVGASSS